MLDDKLPELIRATYNGKILVCATDEAQYSLAAKGLTPAIFLEEFYHSKTNPLEVFYCVKEKGSKPMCDLNPIDIKEYFNFKEEVVNRNIRHAVHHSISKLPKQATRQVLQNRLTIESYLNNINFNWFESASKIFFHALTLDEENHRLSTLEQPFAITFIIEVDHRNCSEHYQKLKKEVDSKLKKMFFLNPSKVKALPILVIVFYDIQKGKTYHDAKAYSNYLNADCKLDQNSICRVAINGENCEDEICWSSYHRPIIHFDYRLKPSDPIKFTTKEEISKLKENIDFHKERIRRSIQDRLNFLGRRYEDNNTAKNKFLNFFKSSPQQDRSYIEEEVQSREIADLMFLMEDYKKAYEIYKGLAEKFEPNERDQLIRYNISEMIQLCLILSRFQSIKLKTNHYETIQKYSGKILQKLQVLSKNKLYRYLMVLIYAFHSFRTFDKNFIRGQYYSYLKRGLIDQNGANSSLIPTLIYEQYANLNLMFNTIDYRRYCYDIVRVSTKFNDFRLYNHYMRCLVIADIIYQNTMPSIEKWMSISLSKAFLQNKMYQDSLDKLKKAWISQINYNEYDSSNKNEIQDSEFTRLIVNHQKIIAEIEKNNPKLLDFSEPNIPIPEVHNVSLELIDELIDNQDKGGMKWFQVGDIFLDNTELTSKGLVKSNLIKILKLFDSSTAQQKELAYRAKLAVTWDEGQPKINEAMLKRHCRNSFVGEPIRITFDLYNPIPNSIEIKDILVEFVGNNQKLQIEQKYLNQRQTIKPFQTKTVEVVVTAKEAGLLELHRISWQYGRVKCQHGIKQAWEMRTENKSTFFKINVVEQSACLKVIMNCKPSYYEGQLSSLQCIFINQGVSTIDDIYFAVGYQDIFGFKDKKLDFSLLPNQQIKQLFSIKIPEEKKKDKVQWKLSNKGIFLYRIGQIFRTLRVINNFNIIKVADIQNLLCERLSTNLHFLTFSIKYDNKDKQKLKLIKSMIIGKHFKIEKIEMNHFNDLTTKYFFFLRKNQSFQIDQYIFNETETNFQQLVASNRIVSSQKENNLDIYFFWKDRNNIGLISSKSLEISAPENNESNTKLPFSFKIKFDSEVDFDFQQQTFLEIDVEIVIKNIFSAKDMNILISLVENECNDICWEGLVEKQLSLKYNEGVTLKVKILVFRSGVFDLSKNIKYVISSNRVTSYTILHSHFQSIYLMIRNKANQRDGDFFDNFEGVGVKRQESFKNFDLL